MMQRQSIEEILVEERVSTYYYTYVPTTVFCICLGQGTWLSCSKKRRSKKRYREGLWVFSRPCKQKAGEVYLSYSSFLCSQKAKK